MSEASPERDEKRPVAPGRSRIVLTDSMFACADHSGNQAVCVALSVAVQTAQFIANKLDAVLSVEFNHEDKSNTYHVVYLDPANAATPHIISGFWQAVKGIANQVPGTIEVADTRKNENNADALNVEQAAARIHAAKHEADNLFDKTVYLERPRSD